MTTQRSRSRSRSPSRSRSFSASSSFSSDSASDSDDDRYERGPLERDTDTKKQQSFSAMSVGQQEEAVQKQREVNLRNRARLERKKARHLWHSHQLLAQKCDAMTRDINALELDLRRARKRDRSASPPLEYQYPQQRMRYDAPPPQRDTFDVQQAAYMRGTPSFYNNNNNSRVSERPAETRRRERNHAKHEREKRNKAMRRQNGDALRARERRVSPEPAIRHQSPAIEPSEERLVIHTPMKRQARDLPPRDSSLIVRLASED